MMRILLTVASFSPDYGGPALTVARLGTALSLLGVDVGLWAPDGSACSSSVVDFALEKGGSVARLSGNLNQAARCFGLLDIVHDNGIWLPYNHRVARFARENLIPRVVSVHGMLEPWALRYRPLKKRLALLAYQRRDLETAQSLHATAPEEASNLADLSFSVPIDVVPNGIDLPDLYDSPVSLMDAPRTMLFMSRVHPKKGVPLLLEAMSRLRPENWRLLIAGPDELGHTAEVEALVKDYGLGQTVQIVGPVWGASKAELFEKTDIFVLPTHSENFGIVVAEALAHEVPVLTTTSAPWQVLEEEGCGWWVEPTLDGLTKGLAAALQTTPEMRQKMGKIGRALVSDRFGWEGIAREMVELYSRSAGRRQGK